MKIELFGYGCNVIGMFLCGMGAGVSLGSFLTPGGLPFAPVGIVGLAVSLTGLALIALSLLTLLFARD